MSRYNVEFERVAYVDFTVEAESKEQAEEIAWSLLETAIEYGEVSGKSYDWDTYGITEAD